MKRRDFPIIRLASWEHLPSATRDQIEARAQHVMPFEWRGQQLQLAARMADIGDGRRFIFARFVGSEDEANWVVGLGHNVDWPQQFQEGTQLKLARRLALDKRLKHISSNFDFPFGRFFYLSATEMGTREAWTVWVSSNGNARWLGNSSSVDINEPFRLPIEPNQRIFDIPIHEVKKLLYAEVHRENSDASVALRWHALSEVERGDSIVCVQRGSIEELRRVLLSILQIEPMVVSQEGVWSWSIQEVNHSSYINYWAPGDQWGEEQPISIRLGVWQQLALNYFVPSLETSLMERHMCAKHRFERSLSLIEVKTQAPTQHERLEAALFLRDWARDKVSPRKLQLLLSRV